MDSEDEDDQEDGSSADEMDDETSDSKKTSQTKTVALNGAQVEAAKALILEAAAGQLPIDSAKAMLIAFYGLSPEQVDAIVGPIIGFTPAAPAAEPAA